jgi:hypothetical protein
MANDVQAHENEHYPPAFKLGRRTYVHDQARGKPIMYIDGVLVLPVGSEIELPGTSISAEVVRVRLLDGSATGEARVCLDVKVAAKT